MSRTKGTFSLTSNIEPKVGAPLDARTIVKLKTDLTASGTFDYPYIGLTVFVEEENKKYTLIGLDTTVSSNWMEESASGAAADITYDNTTSQLQSTNVQDAIDELNAKPAGVQSNWTEDDTSDLSYIQNKPENLVQDADYVHTDNNYDDTSKGKVDALGTASTKNVPTTGDAGNSEVVLGNDTRLSDARPASDVSSWAKASTKPTYTASEVGAIASTLKGAVNGVAELDANGLVPSSQLPSYVDDIIEVADYDHLPISGESGKIYVTLDTNKTYRWSGSGYTEVSPSLALGETSSTAYRGDRGKTAYDHSQDSGRITAAVSSGLYKVAATAQGHVAGLTAVQKSDITALGIPAQDTTYGVVSKTANGLAPQLPNETTTTKYLRQDGTWQVPPNDNTKNTAGSTNSTSKLFLIGATEQSANPQTYSNSSVYATNGTLTATNAQAVLLGINANNGTSGGISLYNGTGNSDNYGIMFRKVSNKGTHGYMQDTNNWATYFTMFLDGTASRGWIFNNKNVGNVASINTDGNAVFNGSVTIGGNATNTSGARMEYNSSTQAIDFVFN